MKFILRLVGAVVLITAAGTAAQLVKTWVESMGPATLPGPNMAESAAAGLFFALLITAGILIFCVKVERRR